MRSWFVCTASALLAFTASQPALSDGSCSGVSCSAVQQICYATLDLDPVTCGLYYGCCYGKTDNLPVGEGQCSGDPCAPGCPNDLCIASGQLGTSQQGLSVGVKEISTHVAPGGAGSGVLAVEVALTDTGAVMYNWWNLGQGGRGWQQLTGSVSTKDAPAVSLVGTYMFVVVRGTDGYLYLNQGSVNKPLTGWQRMNFQSAAAPAIASAGQTTVVVARNKAGTLFYTHWDLGQGSGPWQQISSTVPMDSTPAAALVGGYLFVIGKGTGGQLYLNQGGLDKKFVGWQLMGPSFKTTASAATSGNTTALVVTDAQGHVSYNWWKLGEGGQGWTGLGGNVPTSVAPAAILVNDYLFVIVAGNDGRIHVNQGTLGQPFVGWN